MDDRVEVTSSCRDCDVIPKVQHAGKIINDPDANISYQYMHNGIKILYGSYHSPWMNEIIKNLKGHHEPQEELAFYYLLNILNDDSAMIELGCYWAYYSIWFNRRIKNPYNLCAEPISHKLKAGMSNVKLNCCRNFDFVKAGINDVSKTQIIEGEKVKLFTLGEVMGTSNTFYDVVHSDTQGAEKVFIDMEKEVRKRIGFLVISTHSQELHHSILESLIENNFSILVEHNLKESKSTDGLIVALNRMHKLRYIANLQGFRSIEDYFEGNCKITK